MLSTALSDSDSHGGDYVVMEPAAAGITSPARTKLCRQPSMMLPCVASCHQAFAKAVVLTCIRN